MPCYAQILHFITILFLLFTNANPEIINTCKISKFMIMGPSSTLEKQLSVKDEVIMTSTPSLIITVDKNPAFGNFTSIQAAIDYLPMVNQVRVLIDVHAGIYTEKVRIPASKAYITIQGAGAEVTVVQWGDTATTRGPDGRPLEIHGSATFGVASPYFVAKNITFKNTAPIPPPGAKGMQGVALRVSGDASAIVGCKILGAQDSLYDHRGRHYYKDCYIEGCVDFISGYGRSYFEECKLNAIAPGAVTAQMRCSSSDYTGFSFVNCNVTGSAAVFLGRAWGPFSTVVFAYTYMDKNVKPEGWYDWGDPSRHSTVFYREYACIGPGANTERRVKWSKNLTDEEAKPFTSLDFIDASQWLGILLG